MEDTRFFVDLGLLLVAALAGGVVAQWLRQPLIVGYIVGGIVVSPLTPGPKISDPHTFQAFATIGVVLLMFSISIEFSLKELVRVGAVALLGAPAGIAAMMLLTVLAGMALGWPLAQGAAIGAAISVSSTMVLLKFLQDRGEMNSPHGRVMIGVSLVEDLAVVAMVVLLPVLNPEAGGRLAQLGAALLKAVLFLAPLYWLARRVVPGCSPASRARATRSCFSS